MAKVNCHNIMQPVKIFRIAPIKQNTKYEFVLYLDGCIICKKPVLEILRVDNFGNRKNPVRLKTENIADFIKKMRIIPFIDEDKKREDKPEAQGSGSKFYLLCNEFGVRTKCYQNLSSLNLGRIETDLYQDLRIYKTNLSL